MEISTLIHTVRKVKKSSKGFVEGEHEVRIRITQRKEKHFIHLGFSSSIENWDADNEMPKPSHPHYKELSKRISQFLDDIAFELKLAQKANRYISCIEVKRNVLQQDS